MGPVTGQNTVVCLTVFSKENVSVNVFWRNILVVLLTVLLCIVLLAMLLRYSKLPQGEKGGSSHRIYSNPEERSLSGNLSLLVRPPETTKVPGKR